ncbi:MAG: hypothetical protein WBB29_02525 [Geitlerinemataceae cyanobacterium]
MLQAFEGIYRNGAIELLEFPDRIDESHVLITSNDPRIAEKL